MRTELVAVSVLCDKLNNESSSQLTEVERLRVTLLAKTDFVELLKERETTKEASFFGSVRPLRKGLQRISRFLTQL